jgi:hypothetical protein
MVIRQEYQDRLPLYVLARCPECGAQITEPVDTFSLNGLDWGLRGTDGMGWATVDNKAKKFKYCRHVRIVSWFLNLNGLVPDDLFADKQIHHPGPEVPSLMAIPATVAGVRVVMQRLPIGRFDDEVLTPRYSLYFLTYFAADRRAFDRATGDFFPTYSLERSDTDRDFDLVRHAEEGRLQWIDPESPDQRIVGIAEAPFPYGNIQGERCFHYVIKRSGIQKHRPGLLERIYTRVASLMGGDGKMGDESAD